MPPPGNGPSNKKTKLGAQVSDQFAFTNVHDIKQALRSTEDPNALSKGLWLVYDRSRVN